MKTVLVHDRPASGVKQSRPTERRPNLPARMGRWSAAHWKTATFGWLGLVLVAFAVGGQVGTKQADPTKAGPGESGRMDRILDAGFKLPASESVLIQSRSLRAGTPAFDAAVKDVVARLAAVAAVQNVRSPLDPANGGQIAKGRHAALVEFEIRGDSTKAMDKLAPILSSVADAQRAHPGLFVGEFGGASAAKAVNTAFAHDLKSAGVFSIPLTLIILVVAFGALVAAGIPLLLALTAVFATFGLAALPSHLLPLAPEAFAVVLLIGLAVGVDYSMFYLRREREERAAGRSERAALEAAAATSGRSVLISGLTVMVAMAGLFLTGDATFASFGYATMIVVAFAMVGSLTVLPALLSKLGDRVDRLHVPLVGRLRRDNGESRVWGAIVDRVLRRPLLSAVIAGGLLLALAAPALQLRMATPGPDTFPEVARRGEDLRPHAAGVPGHGAAGQRRRQGRRTSTRRPSARRSTGSRWRHSPPAAHASRSRSTRTATTRSRTSPSRSSAREPTPSRTPAWRRCARTSFLRPSARSRTSRRASPGSPPNGRTRRTS